DLRVWLEAQDLSRFIMKLDQPEALLAILAATPAALSTLVRDIPLDQWVRCPTCDEWSLNEIACHLRDVDLEVNLPRLRTLLAETNPFISGKVTDDWVQERGYDRQDGRAALRELTEARKQLVSILGSLTPEDWQRTARHAIFGPTTLQELIGFTAEHDRVHIQQVLKTIAQTRQT
ncbi:MAG: DinB family protein, partial [Anaerolineales bacterium]